MAITVLCHLLEAGIRVPKEAGLIAMWDAVDLDVTHPTIARYRADGKLMGRHLEMIMMDLLLHGSSKMRAVAVTPEYISGGSIAPLRQ